MNVVIVDLNESTKKNIEKFIRDLIHVQIDRC